MNSVIKSFLIGVGTLDFMATDYSTPCRDRGYRLFDFTKKVKTRSGRNGHSKRILIFEKDRD